MVIVPGRFIFLETPRTASRSVAETLIESCRGSKRSNCRHTPIKDIPTNTGLPIVTFTRYPVLHLFSWWKYGLRNHEMWVFKDDMSGFCTFSEFTKKPDFCPIEGFETDCLNIYHAIADVFWPLELGLDRFFDRFGVFAKNHHHIGKIKHLQGTCLANLEYLTKRYGKDFETYRFATVTQTV